MVTWTPGSEHLHSILATVGLILQSVGRPKSGLTGSVFVLGTDQGGFILKVSQEPGFDWKLSKERLVYGQLLSQNVPAPRVLVRDLSRSLVPFAYTLSECLPGITLSQAYSDMDAGTKIDVYHQLGDFLGRMHSLTFDRFGDSTEQKGEIVAGPAFELAQESLTGNVGPFTTWREMHREIVQGRLSYLSRTEFGDLTGPIGRWFEAADGLLDCIITPRLLHMDLHRSNILVSGGKVSGFLGCGRVDYRP